MFRNNAAFEDQTNVIGKIERRVDSIERAVRSLPFAGTPAASGPDRAASSGADEPVKHLTRRVDRLEGEGDRHTVFATKVIEELQAEHRTLADRMLEGGG